MNNYKGVELIDRNDETVLDSMTPNHAARRLRRLGYGETVEEVEIALREGTVFQTPGCIYRPVKVPS